MQAFNEYLMVKLPEDTHSVLKETESGLQIVGHGGAEVIAVKVTSVGHRIGTDEIMHGMIIMVRPHHIIDIDGVVPGHGVVHRDYVLGFKPVDS